MTEMYLSRIGAIGDIVGGFTMMQMIAIGVVLVLALLIGLLIGGIAFYRSGIKRGKKRGIKDAVAIAMKKADERTAAEVERVRREEAEKAAGVVRERDDALALVEREKKDREAAVALADAERKEKEAALALVESLRREKDALTAERDAAVASATENRTALEALQGEVVTARQETEQARTDAERANREREAARTDAEEARTAAEQARTVAEAARTEAEQAREDAERRQREAEEMRAQRDESAARAAEIPERRTDIKLLNKQEILAFAGDLEDHLPASVYERGGGELPDSCRVGICTFLLVYERKGMVKLVLRLDKEKAEALEGRFRLFTPAVYPKGGDWYKWILSSEVTDLGVVTEAIRAAYEYTYASNYDALGEIDVEMANRDENAINDSIVRYKDLPDRDFIVASDAMDGGTAAYRLYGKKEMTYFVRRLAHVYPIAVSESDNELSPNTCKVSGKTFLMIYEKDGVSKLIFRMSESEFASVKEKHPSAEISAFPKAKGYHWYVVYIDESFTGNEDIEAIIKSACAHVHGLRG